MALCFKEAGKAWVPAKPWHHDAPSKSVSDAALLPKEAQDQLSRIHERDNDNAQKTN